MTVRILSLLYLHLALCGYENFECNFETNYLLNLCFYDFSYACRLWSVEILEFLLMVMLVMKTQLWILQSLIPVIHHNYVLCGNDTRTCLPSGTWLGAMSRCITCMLITHQTILLVAYWCMGCLTCHK